MDPIEQDQLLYGGEDPDYGTEPAEILDAGTANWHLRHILAIEAQAHAEDALFAVELERLTARRKERAAAHAEAIAWHREPLSQWHRRERAAGRLKTKRVTLPAGACQLQAASKTEVTDPDQLRAWLEARADGEGGTWADAVYRVTEKFLISELTKRAKVPKADREPGSVAHLVDPDTGETVPGVRSVVLPDSWFTLP